MKPRQSGFTLVELAIALMVIGLLIGGVLKGQELIENATGIRIIRDVNNYKNIVATFELTYDGFPGDIRSPGSHIPNCTGAPCTGTGISRLGNGKIDMTFKPQFPNIPYWNAGHAHYRNSEAESFWVQLMRSGLMNETEMMTGVIRSPLIDTMYLGVVYYNASVTGAEPTPGNYLVFADVRHINQSATGGALSASRAAYIDEKIDDGKPFGGDVRVLGRYSYSTVGLAGLRDNCVVSGETEYNRAVKNGKECGLAFLLN